MITMCYGKKQNKPNIHKAKRQRKNLNRDVRFRFRLAEKEGFEPPRDFHPLSVFKTDPFSQTWVFLHPVIS